MRICIVYDCLYPRTVGGAERWYRNLASALAAAGHDVTYLTMRQWDRGDPPRLPGVKVRAVAPRMGLYARGRRRILPTVLFGLGVLVHLARERRYDVVHTASFPYFSVLAAAGAGWIRRFQLVVDWHELWTRGYWLDYLGPVGGRLGWLVQRACVRAPHRAFAFSRLHLRRLRKLGYRGEPTLLEGEYDAPPREPLIDGAEPVVVFAGRHIPEKRVPELVEAMALLRDRASGIRCTIFGEGPQRAEVLRLIELHGLEELVKAPGFVSSEELEQGLKHALCLALPSRREGYGLVVVEAAALGTPSVVVRDQDNAAVELIAEGENGFVASSAAPADLAEAILRVREAGPSLRRSTAAWFGANARRLSLQDSLVKITRAYSSQ